LRGAESVGFHQSRPRFLQQTCLVEFANSFGFFGRGIEAV
jgi:hypothetical protein